MSNSESPDSPPSFEDAFRGDDVEQRVYGTSSRRASRQQRTPSPSKLTVTLKTARKYLGWFSEIGIVTRHNGHPATYERNDAYFEWRRINQLAADHSVEDLQQCVQELTSRINEYEDTYDTATPAAVDAVAAAEASDNRTVDEVYSDLSDWAIARDERTRYEHTRQQRASAETEQISG